MKPPDDWPRVKLVLEGALACEGADRQAFLAEACGADRELRTAIDRLLAANDRVEQEQFLETPCALVLDGRGGDDDLSGRVVNSYQLISRLGAGGMGVVYRARDTRLNRDVAFKVLPDAFAADAGLARFKQEAHVLASLNHPGIGSIYGFEESGGMHALVLELVEGPTLAERIARGPLPLDDALPIARQLAEAIEAAHEHRIIHRDLKPANIKLTPDGSVKVLDFGLAEAFDARGGEAAGAEPGMIAGTAAYMSPEQARGKPVDRRCDIWAFGCVFYEMLTGRRLFDGHDTADILARITGHEPNLEALPGSTPPSIRRLLRRCLETDRRKRLPDIGVARIEIDDALAAPLGGGSPVARLTRVAAAILGAALIGATAASLWYSRRPSSPPISGVRASISLAAGLDFGVQQPSLAISPDGSRVVYRPIGGGPLFSRFLTDTESSAIAGTEGAVNPFFSPDGKWLAFFVGPALKKVAFDGGAVVTLATLPHNVGAQGYRGGTWSDDGTIAFASSTGAGLYSVAERGGEPQPLTTIDRRANEAAHRWPHFLPGGRAILFTVKSTNLQSFDDAQIVVRALDNGSQHAVAQGDSAQYLPTGHLVYARAGALYAVRFDVERLAVIGAPTKVVDAVVTHPESGAAQVAISRTGTLVYAAGGSTTAARPLLWVDRAGVARPVNDRQAPFWWPRLSPDGQRIVVVIDAPFSKLWVLDVERGTFTRASQLPGDQDRAVWMPDGAHLTFAADTTGSGAMQLYSERVDGSADATLLVDGGESPSPLSWSPDGQRLLYRQISAATGQDVWVFSADVRTSMPLLQTAANEWSAAFSPDGRWIAYVSDESGRAEVYVRPFPGPGPRHQVSVDGGTAPVWSRDGRELFFGKSDTLFATSVSLGAAFANGPPRRLFSGPYGFDDVTVSYDVTPDGRHFLVPRSRVVTAPRQVELALNWFEDVNRLAPR